MDRDVWESTPYKTDDYERLVANVDDGQGRALLEAWELVEQAVHRTANRLGYELPPGTVALLVLPYLEDDDRIDNDVVPRLRSLLGPSDAVMQHLRKVVHPRAYIQSALKVIHRLGTMTE